MNTLYKYVVLSCILIIPSLLFGQKLALGGGISKFGYNAPLGYNVRAHVEVKEHWSSSIEGFVSFWEDTYNNENNEWLVYGAEWNVHYRFKITDKIQLYPLLGLQARKEQIQTTYPLTVTVPQLQEWVYWAVNYGLGLQYRLEDTIFFVEIGENTIPRPRYILGSMYLF